MSGSSPRVGRPRRVVPRGSSPRPSGPRVDSRDAGGAPMPDEPRTRAMRALPTQVDLPELEREVLRRWREGKVFERSLEQTSAGAPWVFYEGPPTANGMPGVHHVEARVFKDLFPRFKTMKGFSVRRKAGWD